MSLQTLTFIFSLRFTGSPRSSRANLGPQLTQPSPRPALRVLSCHLLEQTYFSHSDDSDSDSGDSDSNSGDMACGTLIVVIPHCFSDQSCAGLEDNASPWLQSSNTIQLSSHFELSVRQAVRTLKLDQDRAVNRISQELFKQKHQEI